MKKLLILVFVLIPWRVYAIGASSYIVMDASSNRVLEGSNIKDERLIASTTKIMTAIVAIENKSLDEKVVVSKEVLKAYGSNIYIEVGEELTLKDLLYGLMLRSGNDAAIEISRVVAGNTDNMTKLMNEKAKALNMTNTLFINASGLENEEGLGNKSTAYDMALLMSYALKNKVFTQIIGTKNYKTQSSYKSYVWHNKNKLLDSYEYCIGGKTGFTKKSRRTLVTAASREDKTLVVVTLNDPDDFADHKALYEKNFKKYNLVKVLDKNSFKIDTQGTYDQVYLKNDLKVLLTSDEEKNIKINYDLVKKDSYEDNETVGSVVVKLKGKVIAKEDILARKNEKIQENFWHKVLDFLMFWN